MSEIDRIINEVNGSMAIEGMALTNEDKERIRVSLSDSEKYKKILKELIAKHSAQVNLCNTTMSMIYQ